MATKKNVVSIKQDIPEQLETLRADIALLAETVKQQALATVSEKSTTVKGLAATKAEAVKDAATTTAGAAKGRYDELTSTAETKIKENPLTSVAIAVGAGLVLGALTRR